jgi:hypothetical protein
MLVYAIIFSVIGILREDPLSPGILDMFFQKYPIMCLFFQERVYILKIPQIFNSLNSNDLSGGQQFDSTLSMEFEFNSSSNWLTGLAELSELYWNRRNISFLPQ